MASRLFSVLVLFVLASPAHAGWFSSDNYEDCMLGKMKGQNTSMWSAADKECKRQFKIEFQLYTAAIKWRFEGIRGDTKVTLEDEDEYIVTSGEFMFSEQPCENSKPADFTAASIKFERGVGLYTWGLRRDICAKVLSFKGRYK